MIDSDAWHRELLSGSLRVEFDAGHELDLYSLVSVVDAVMAERHFRESTTRRVRVILQELIANVADHVPDRQVKVRLTLHESHLRRVAIDVGDRGPGFEPLEVLGRYTERLLQGEREHGLLLVSRLASGFHPEPPDLPWPVTGHVGCDVIEPPANPSVLLRNDAVALVRVEYTSPKVLWVGRDESYVNYLSGVAIDRLIEAAHQLWLPVLELYLGGLRSGSYLAVRITGHDVPTARTRKVGPRPGSASWMAERAGDEFLDHVFLALEVFFPNRIAAGRVVVVTPDTDWVLRDLADEWAERHRLPRFDSDAAVEEFLAGRTPGT